MIKKQENFNIIEILYKTVKQYAQKFLNNPQNVFQPFRKFFFKFQK